MIINLAKSDDWKVNFNPGISIHREASPAETPLIKVYNKSGIESIKPIWDTLLNIVYFILWNR